MVPVRPTTRTWTGRGLSPRCITRWDFRRPRANAWPTRSTIENLGLATAAAKVKADCRHPDGGGRAAGDRRRAASAGRLDRTRSLLAGARGGQAALRMGPQGVAGHGGALSGQDAGEVTDVQRRTGAATAMALPRTTVQANEPTRTDCFPVQPRLAVRRALHAAGAVAATGTSSSTSCRC